MDRNFTINDTINTSTSIFSTTWAISSSLCVVSRESNIALDFMGAAVSGVLLVDFEEPRFVRVERRVDLAGVTAYIG